MRTRIITGTLLTVAVSALIYLGGTWFGVGAVLALTFAVHEEYKALSLAGHRPVAWPTWLALILCVPLAAWRGQQVVFAILTAAAIITNICVVFRKEPKLEDTLMSLLPLFSIVLPGLGIVSLTAVEPLGRQRALTAMLVAVPVAGDTFAYFVGSFVRGPKLCPEVSPNKTISGAVGGLVGSLLLAVAVRWIAGWLIAPEELHLLPTWIGSVMLGLTGGIASQVGDLTASMVKRHTGIKDFSSLFPGHGGMLDRIDSVLFMALVLFAYRMAVGY